MISGDTTGLSLLFFFTLLIVAQAKLSIHPSDYEAAISVHTDLGVYGQRDIKSQNEWRITGNSSLLRATSIVFKSQGLNGVISPAIGELSELTQLSLPDNHLLGPIPDEIAGCRKLEILNLRTNQFSGEVPPALSTLVNLRILDLSGNSFYGNLDFLKFKYFFPNLEYLSIANNTFDGDIPDWVRRLPTFEASGNPFLGGLTEEQRKRPGYKEVFSPDIEDFSSLFD